VVEQIKRIGKDPVLLSLTLSKCRHQMTQQRAEAERELVVVERELSRLHADLRRTAGDAATDGHAAARLADFHQNVQAADERAAALRREIADADAGQITKAEVDAALGEFDGVWSRLSPKEQAKLMRMLVQRVDYDATKGSVSITFHPLGLRTLSSTARELADVSPLPSWRLESMTAGDWTSSHTGGFEAHSRTASWAPLARISSSTSGVVISCENSKGNTWSCLIRIR